MISHASLTRLFGFSQLQRAVMGSKGKKNPQPIFWLRTSLSAFYCLEVDHGTSLSLTTYSEFFTTQDTMCQGRATKMRPRSWKKSRFAKILQLTSFSNSSVRILETCLRSPFPACQCSNPLKE